MTSHALVCARCGTVENKQDINETLIRPQGPCSCGSKRFEENIIYEKGR